MALKRKKLDAICAHLKKTSAVDVNATTENGVDGDAAVADDGNVKDGAKATSTNNNEETVTDLNENPEPDSGSDPSTVEDSAKPPLSFEVGESSAEDGKSSAESAASVTSTPSSSSTSVPYPGPETSSPWPKHRSSTVAATTTTTTTTPAPLTGLRHEQPSGSGRRKSRKAAKPRLVFQPQEQFDNDLLEREREEGLGVESVDFDGGRSSSFARLGEGRNGVTSSEEPEDDSLLREPGSPSTFADQYSFQQQQKQLLQQHKDSIGRFLNSSSFTADSPGPKLACVPLDLSTSKTSDNSESLSADMSFHDKDNEEDDDADDDDDGGGDGDAAAADFSAAGDSSTRTSTAASSPVTVHPSPLVVTAEAKVLADYAKNTMNELLSIYGFSGAGVEGVDKQLAQKHLENLSSLRALAASTQSPSKAHVAPPAHGGSGGGGAAKLPNGRHVQKDATASANSLSSSEGLSSSSSGHGLVRSGSSQPKKSPGNPTKYKFHNIKPPIKHVSGGSGPPQKVSSSDYNKYIKKFHNGVECGGSHCRDLGYRDHYHCHDCNFKVFIKKEEMVRHYKWHKKRDESLQHGFLRYSPLDDCSVKYGNCTHNKRQTHYHCIQSGCDKVYISTSDVQMHANYHRKDSAIIQEGFQRFRATEDCGTTTCSFYGQRTTHFHCRRSNCNFTFKNKADMEKHKSYHQKDEILGRDGFKKFMKYEHCSYQGCRFSKVSNHIHCIRPGCCYVLHSTAQLYSHKRKHERREFENLYRTFRQAQRPQQIQSAAAVAAAAQLSQLQQDPSRPLASTVASLPTSAVPMAPKVNLASLPLQGYGEPMVAQTVMASQLMQPLPMPIKLGTGAAAVLAPNVSVASASTTAVAQPLALTTTPSASHSTSTTSSNNNNNNSSSSSSGGNGNNRALTPAALQIKQEPKSDTESDAESKSSTKTTGTSTLPFTMATKLENVKDENLNSSLTLPIPAQQATKMEPLEPGTQGVLKTLSDAAAALDSSSKKGLLTMAPFPRVKRVGAPEKRERDETWKNYLIRYTANDPCNSRCQLLYKDHYHCKIAGCQVLFRSKDGVREHAKFHDLQDRITPMVYNKYCDTEACPQSCPFSQKQTHFHCNWTGCDHVIPELGQTFARLEHYRIHEYAKAAAGKNYRLQNAAGSAGRVEDLAHRRRGRPPKYPRLDVPSVPKVDLSEQEIRESSQQTADGEGSGADEKVINGFRKFDATEVCPDDQCMYRLQLHYHCGRPRCHTATDRIDVLNLHAKDFHSFITILENFEFFDRNVNCRRSHCNNNRTNRHYHCMRPRCDYSFVRHSTMTQHDKKHTGCDISPSVPTRITPPGARITPIQLLRRPDGQTYIPIVPAPTATSATLDKSVVKASGTFYPLSGLPSAVPGTPVGMVTSKGQQFTSGLTLTIPANLVTAGIPVMASMASVTSSTTATSIVPVIAGGILTAGNVVTSAPPLTVLLQQKSGNGVPQPSWSSMRSSMYYSLQASCGRPFCKLKKKDHYHCLECNQAFSDPSRLRGHISKHGVRFKRLTQPRSGATAAAAAASLPLAMVAAPGQQVAQMGLDLSTAKLHHDDKGGLGEGEEEGNKSGEGEEGDEEDGGDDENNSLSSSLNLSIGRISTSLTGGDGSGADALEVIDEGSLIIDEEAKHSDYESMQVDDGMNGNEDEECEDESLSTYDISANAGASSPSTSRRSGRKRSAPRHADFVSSDDANLMAKQMKLKLSAPIPSSVPVPPVMRNVPEGFIRFHCSNDCGYIRCAYRQSVTHYHCVRSECGYGFSDKSRIIQHQFRHERLDKLMGNEFQQFRATVRCGRGDCEFSEKASHFHCQKCAFVCADSSKVLAHRKYHAKMDNISSNGFQKFGSLQDCGMTMCTYSRKQTHYHCTHEGCNHAVLGPAQMAPHKLKHASHDV